MKRDNSDIFSLILIIENYHVIAVHFVCKLNFYNKIISKIELNLKNKPIINSLGKSFEEFGK